MYDGGSDSDGVKIEFDVVHDIELNSPGTRSCS